MEFNDICPICNEECKHVEGNDGSYLVRCYWCNLDVNFDTYDDYLEFVDEQAERRSKNIIKRGKKDKCSKTILTD